MIPSVSLGLKLSVIPCLSVILCESRFETFCDSFRESRFETFGDSSFKSCIETLFDSLLSHVLGTYCHYCTSVSLGLKLYVTPCLSHFLRIFCYSWVETLCDSSLESCPEDLF